MRSPNRTHELERNTVEGDLIYKIAPSRAVKPGLEIRLQSLHVKRMVCDLNQNLGISSLEPPSPA